MAVRRCRYGESPFGGDLIGRNPTDHGKAGTKHSLLVDLKDEAARAQVKALVATADVVVESYRPGVMARLGLDAAALCHLQEALANAWKAPRQRGMLLPVFQELCMRGGRIALGQIDHLDCHVDFPLGISGRADAQ